LARFAIVTLSWKRGYTPPGKSRLPGDPAPWGRAARGVEEGTAVPSPAAPATRGATRPPAPYPIPNASRSGPR